MSRGKELGVYPVISLKSAACFVFSLWQSCRITARLATSITAADATRYLPIFNFEGNSSTSIRKQQPIHPNLMTVS